MPSLVFVAGPIAGRRYRLAQGDYIIGRRSDCQIFVPDMRVSRQHSRIREENNGWVIEDLGSNNGTFLNGTKVQNAPLRPDDEIQIAGNRIRVEEVTGTPGTDRKFPEGHVTIVDVTSRSILRSREEENKGGAFKSSTTQSLRLVERKLAALTDILHATASASGPSALMEKLANAVLAMFPQAESVGVLVEDEHRGDLRVECQRHRRDSFHGELRVPGAIISHVVADRRGVLLDDSVGSGDEAGGNRMGAPLTYQSSTYGVVYVESSTQRFRQDDVDLLATVAAQTGMAMHATRIQSELAKNEQIERDLRVARQIQRSLLPATAPNVVGLSFAMHYEPAYHIGGDFYDFIWHDASHLALVVGDVAGKAISAALYMARLTSELRSRAGLAKTPSRLIRRVNQEMAQMGEDGMFATLAYCLYDLDTRSLVFTNAGHCVPLLRRGDRVFPLHAERAHGAPVGVLPDLEIGEARVQLHSEDMILLVSDGILESRDAKGNEYGLARLSRRVRSARGGPEDLIKVILQDIDSHTGDRPQADDITLLAMAIDDRRAKRKTTTLQGVAPAEAHARLGTEPPDDTLT
ncbi:MAG: SpoIIE family protein phosphatase [Myxococcales bacterium]|nr:SpoIIE family protein phosphatase [Myxococcales bacterium]